MRCIREYHILSSELLDPSGHQWKTRLDNLRGQLFAGKKDGGGAKNEEESASMGRFWMPGGAHAWLVFVAFGAYGQTTFGAYGQTTFGAYGQTTFGAYGQTTFGLSALYVLTSTTVDELSQGRGRAATRAAAKEGASKPSDVALILGYMRVADQHNQEMAVVSRRMYHMWTLQIKVRTLPRFEAEMSTLAEQDEEWQARLLEEEEVVVETRSRAASSESSVQPTVPSSPSTSLSEPSRKRAVGKRRKVTTPSKD
ncbi:hypothetical protein BASA81_007602 [Batrachochytrium salamandrivorans]|nr:hypothetical protein BASA81_007602 [Batrachochytrium salamandrivorans]